MPRNQYPDKIKERINAKGVRVWHVVASKGTPPNRKQLDNDFPTYALAVEALETLLGASRFGIQLQWCATPFGQYWQEWIARERAMTSAREGRGEQPTYAGGTLDNYEGAFKMTFGSGAGKGCDLSRVPLCDVDYKELDRCLRQREQRVSAGTAKIAVAAARALFKAARRADDVGVNPAELLSVRVPYVEQEALSEEDQARFYALVKGHRHETILIVMLETALRVGEAVALRWPDFDPIAGTLRVRRKGRNTKGGQVIEEYTKSRRNDTIELLGCTIETLEAHRRKRQEAGDYQPFGPIFPGRTRDGHIGRNAVIVAFAKLGLPQTGTHTLRRTAATTAYEEDWDETSVAALLRHQGTQTVSRYKRLRPTRKQAQLLRLEARMRGRRVPETVMGEG